MKKENFKGKKKFSMEEEIKQQIFDLIMIVVIFSLAIFFGKYFMNRYGGTWLSFNIPALGFAIVGLVIWYCIKNRYYERYKSPKVQEDKRKG